MSARHTLTPELRAEVLRLEDDLRIRVAALPQVQQAWQDEYDAARAVERTSAAWEEWVDERVTLAAVAWVLTTVFIRFCEDNTLVKPVWIGGPRSSEALEAQQQFLRETARANTDVTDREWLLQAVKHLQSLPATAGLVDASSPMWLVSPSGDAATRLLTFWRARDEEGNLLRDLADPALDTRFLGDLYQDISEDAKKRYALLQTPVFVEEFILDRTLEPALDERALEGFKMIDPTCGSGHFLLGGFQRLLDRWHRHAPAMDERERVQAALDSVYGVDINPFAVATARFRLTVAALRASGLTSLKGAPAFKYHLAVGDSLLHGLAQPELDLGASLSVDTGAANFAYATENLGSLRSILQNGQYDVVVGNPPYIQVRDRGLGAIYRSLYPTSKGTFPLSVPFMEKFFALAKLGEGAGWVGKITSNSFSQREFGVHVVEKLFPKLDLLLVINSEGAWIPGHNMDGTPTVILVGRHRAPTTMTVRVVLSKGLRESGQEPDGKGPYWDTIVRHLDDDEFENDWVVICDIPRLALAKHPWSLVGGGANTLIDSLRLGRPKLGDMATRVGFYGDSHADELFFISPRFAERQGYPAVMIHAAARGASVRDWVAVKAERALLPYDTEKRILPASDLRVVERLLWPWRTTLWSRKVFGGSTYREAGEHWLAWHQLPRDEKCAEETIAYAEIAPDNHFVLDDGTSVFNRTAPVVKLPIGAAFADHWRVTLNLNSSVACCWMRNQSKPKGGAAGQTWSRTHQFNGTRLEQIPIAAPPSPRIADRILRLSSRLDELTNAWPLDHENPPNRELFESRRSEFLTLRAHLIAWQEELDWEYYRLYELIDEDLTYKNGELPGLNLGERAFEIALARGSHPDVKSREWLSQSNVKLTETLPSSWPDGYAELINRRIGAILSIPAVALIEVPENKRRWSMEGWTETEARVLGDWCLARLERRNLWFDAHGRPTPKSLAVLADDVTRDNPLASALHLVEGRPDVSVLLSLERLVDENVVPFLAAYRLTQSGLRTAQSWLDTWNHQRMEDAGFNSAAVPAPPVFTPDDFLDQRYWSLRGRLDIPREGFILYPNTAREGDASPVIGWAGWDHAQQALALATLIQAGEQQGWADDRLVPLVAGLDELLPWVEQWHHEPDALYGGSSPAEFFAGLLDNYMAKLGATRETLRAWRPSAPTRGRRARG